MNDSPLISVVIPTRNAFGATAATLRALFDQTLPPAVLMEVVVVDDASTDNSADQLAGEFGPRIMLIRQARNEGRSATRNRGAQAASGQWLALLDCDCLPSPGYLDAMLTALIPTAVCVGTVRYMPNGFWAHYQEMGARRRLDAHRHGEPGALSTACMAMDRRAFLAIGGYDEGYRHYGFEDRDLLLRLQAAGLATRHVEHACVEHADQVDLRTLMKKNMEAAQYTAPRFHAAHPEVFRRSGYARIDASLHPWMARLGALSGAAALWLTAPLARLLECRAIPLRMRIFMARCLLASAYCLGSLKARQNSTRASE